MPQQAAQRIIGHRTGVDLAAEGCPQRDELVAGGQMVLDARKQVGFAMAGAWRTEQDAAARLFRRHGQDVVQDFIGPSIDRLRVGPRELAE